jgi:hypothetical protein
MLLDGIVAIFTEFVTTARGNDAKELRQCRSLRYGLGVVVLGLAFGIFSRSLVTDNLLDGLFVLVRTALESVKSKRY